MIDKVLEFLRENNEVAFATAKEGKPKIRAFQIMKIEGKDLFFATSSKKDIFYQLQENPFIEILSMKGKISVRCIGEALFDVNEETKRWIFENNPVLPRLYNNYMELEYFRMKLSSIDYYDLLPTPPIFKHINIETNEINDGFVGDKYSKK